MWNLPNLITLGRLLLAPPIFWLVLKGHVPEALVLFLIACMSDALDGWLARRYGGNTLGAMLDPLADKALLAGAYITLTMLHVLPLWLTILVLTRDVLVLGGVLVISRFRACRVQPLYISKVNTVAQMGLIGVALAPSVIGVTFPRLLMTLCWCVGVTTIASGTAYLHAVVSGKLLKPASSRTAAAMPRG